MDNYFIMGRSLLATTLALLILFSLHLGHAISSNRYCAMNIHSGLQVAGNGGQATPTNSYGDELICRKACCHSEDCHGYDWDARESSCVLFSCVDKNTGCSLGANKDSRMGLIEGSFIQTENLKAGDVLQPSLQIAEKKSSPNYQGQQKESVGRPSKDLGRAKSSVPDLEGLGFQQEKESFKRATAGASVVDKVVPASRARLPSAMSSDEIVRKDSIANVTKVRVKHPRRMSHIKTNSSQTVLVSSPLDSRHVHTTKTSLIVALFFGLSFLVVVVFVVSRRWWESTTSFRSGYQRVEYLMNGNLSR